MTLTTGEHVLVTSDNRIVGSTHPSLWGGGSGSSGRQLTSQEQARAAEQARINRERNRLISEIESERGMSMTGIRGESLAQLKKRRGSIATEKGELRQEITGLVSARGGRVQDLSGLKLTELGGVVSTERFASARTKSRLSSDGGRPDQFGASSIQPAPTGTEQFKSFIKDKEPVKGTISFVVGKAFDFGARAERKKFKGARIGSSSPFFGETRRKTQFLVETAPFFTPAAPALFLAQAVGTFTPGGRAEASRTGKVISKKTGVPTGISTTGVQVASAGLGLFGGSRLLKKTGLGSPKTSLIGAETKITKSGKDTLVKTDFEALTKSGVLQTKRGLSKGTSTVRLRPESVGDDLFKGTFSSVTKGKIAPEKGVKAFGGGSPSRPFVSKFGKDKPFISTAKGSVGEVIRTPGTSTSSGLRVSTFKAGGKLRVGKDKPFSEFLTKGEILENKLVATSRATTRGIRQRTFFRPQLPRSLKSSSEGLVFKLPRQIKSSEKFRGSLKQDTIQKPFRGGGDSLIITGEKGGRISFDIPRRASPKTPSVPGTKGFSLQQVPGSQQGINMELFGQQVARQSIQNTFTKQPSKGLSLFTSSTVSVLNRGRQGVQTFRPQTSQELKQSSFQPSQTFMTLGRPSVKPTATPLFNVGQKPKTKSGGGVSAFPGSTTKQTPTQKPKQVPIFRSGSSQGTQLRFGGSGHPTPSTPFVPPPTTGVPFGGFPLPLRLPGGRTKRKFKGSQRFAEVPSFLALAFDIKGKKRSRGKSGLKFSPISPDFSFATLFSKKKKKSNKKRRKRTKK